ncbi:MAG: protein-L-isoaspartate O-methyltransferase family protein [Rhodoferax sp.]
MADIPTARFNMVEQQVRPWNVYDPVILELLQTVPREQFVPAGHEAHAYADVEIPLGNGQTMLAPKMAAKLVQDARVQKGDRVLQIGAGSGYVSALLAHLCERVVALECDAEMAALAQANLLKAGLRNVAVRQADGAEGAAVDGPFNAIVLCGSVAQVPQALLDQLAEGGRLVAVVGGEPIMHAEIYTRTGTNSFTKASPWDANLPRLKGFAEIPRFQF